MQKPIHSMTVAELDALVGGDDDDIAQAAMEELDLRLAAREDNRVAQALGRAVGEQPS